MSFRRGDKIEVCSKEDGFMGSYYAATVIEKLGVGESYRVVYETLLKEDESGLLIETVAADEVRPRPPTMPFATKFFRHEKVDAFDNDGWWVGEVIHRKGPMHTVYFHTTGDIVIYPVNRLRFHLDWHNGIWVVSQNSF